MLIKSALLSVNLLVFIVDFVKAHNEVQIRAMFGGDEQVEFFVEKEKTDLLQQKYGFVGLCLFWAC